MQQPSPTQRRRLVGVVVSDAMNKTRVVAVARTVLHPKYLRRYEVRRRFAAHDEANAYKVGDTVLIEETRPRSRRKRWIIVEKIKGGVVAPVAREESRDTISDEQ